MDNDCHLIVVVFRQMFFDLDGVVRKFEVIVVMLQVGEVSSLVRNLKR